jgi:hypothetical protein
MSSETLELTSGRVDNPNAPQPIVKGSQKHKMANGRNMGFPHWKRNRELFLERRKGHAHVE